MIGLGRMGANMVSVVTWENPLNEEHSMKAPCSDAVKAADSIHLFLARLEKEIEQMISVRHIAAVSTQLARIRARTKEASLMSASSVVANSGHHKQ
jgi:6-phosphogluconate dehydrogenase (decarboxylating)